MWLYGEGVREKPKKIGEENFKASIEMKPKWRWWYLNSKQTPRGTEYIQKPVVATVVSTLNYEVVWNVDVWFDGSKNYDSCLVDYEIL